MNMKLKIISIITILLFIFSLFGCASIPEEDKGAATGAAIGGATGAVAGALLGESGESAIIGSLAGALVGGLIGHYAYDVKRTREETAQKYNYQSSTGAMVRIEDVSIIPATVKPGDKVELKATYALLDASPNSDLSVTEIREIKHAGELIGKPEINVARLGGTYTSTVPIYLPSDAAKGKYSVITTIKTSSASDSRETFFTVQ
jgi:hypothetical protein